MFHTRDSCALQGSLCSNVQKKNYILEKMHHRSNGTDPMSLTYSGVYRKLVLGTWHVSESSMMVQWHASTRRYNGMYPQLSLSSSAANLPSASASLSDFFSNFESIPLLTYLYLDVVRPCTSFLSFAFLLLLYLGLRSKEERKGRRRARS